MSMWNAVLLVSACLLVSGQQDFTIDCADQQTCASCIRIAGCDWCIKPAVTKNSTLSQCAKRHESLEEESKWCPIETNLVKVDSMHEKTEDVPLSSKKGEEVQVQPQRMKLRLRRGVEHKIHVTYRQAEDYPVDLYYLMDLSKSMDKNRDTLSTLGVRLAEAMKKLTSNFKLGFGSFVDKVELPMTSTQPDKKLKPCDLNATTPCAAPYGYKHQLSLTDNATLFEERVKAAPVSGNLDGPEGGLDAMMQAMVCTDRIGWRPKARRLMVFSTDEGYHMAGDGRLAGIIEPNDGLCHLDAEGLYDWSLLQDYPSISQINKKAQENSINVIFAVDPYVEKTYEELRKRIGGSSVGTLKDNSNNVVDLVSGEYKKLVNSVTMTHSAPPLIDVKYYSKCINGARMEKNKCDGVRVNIPIEFEVVIKATGCPNDPKDWKTEMEIKPRGLDESLKIDLEFICDCNCSTEGNPGFKTNDSECNYHGNLVCGVCSCYDGYNGEYCQCIGSQDVVDKAASDTACRKGNDTMVCSGQGTCTCGVCTCNSRTDPSERFSGKFCEYDNFSCDRTGGKICGGPDRGTCENKQCTCMPGWSGVDCNCKEDKAGCIAPGDDGIICSGQGECKCGECICNVNGKIRYSQPFCAECSTCPGKRCDALKDYVECAAYKSGPLYEKSDDACWKYFNQSDVEFVDKIPKDSIDTENVHTCRVPSSSDCNFVFQYSTNDTDDMKNKIFITVEQKQQCPEPADALGVALWVILSTVLLGFLILLIWKILTTIHDKREFAKFEKERTQAKWDRGDNPLYKPSTTNFQNPAYNTKR